MVKWFSCSPLPCFLFQFLSAEPNSSFSQFHEDDDTLTKTRLCPWYLNLWHWFSLDGTEEHQFCCLLARKASSVYTSALHWELQQASNCHWGSGNPAGSGCLGNTLNCYIPSCQGHVSFLRLFSSIRTVLAVREWLVQLRATSHQGLWNWDPQAERRICSKPLLKVELKAHRFTNEIHKFKVLMF